MEYSGTKHCGSCKHFEPSTEWRRGWCRNTLLFAPSQSHLVDSEDLDCSRGARDFWEPNQDDADSQKNAGQQHVKMPNFHNPLTSFAPAPAGPAFAAAGASGGHMMFASSGSGGGGYDDDDYGYDDDFGYEPEPEPEPNQPANRRNRPSRSKTGGSSSGGRTRSASYQSEERYWTDYLRIALPVIGIVLMLGLLWIWASHLLGGPSDNTDVTSTDTVGLVTTTTPETTAVSTPNTNTNAGEIPIGNTQTTQPPVTVPPTETPASGDNQAGGNTQETPPADSTTIEVGAYVMVSEDGVNMRQEAGTSAEVVRQVDTGELFLIRSGPEEVDGYTWWEVVSETTGDSGFIVEDFLELSTE